MRCKGSGTGSEQGACVHCRAPTHAHHDHTTHLSMHGGPSLTHNKLEVTAACCRSRCCACCWRHVLQRSQALAGRGAVEHAHAGVGCEGVIAHVHPRHSEVPLAARVKKAAAVQHLAGGVGVGKAGASVAGTVGVGAHTELRPACHTPAPPTGSRASHSQWPPAAAAAPRRSSPATAACR